MSARDSEEIEAIEVTLLEALAKHKEISFVSVFEGMVSGIAVGHRVVGIDLAAKRFATDCMDDWIDFAEIHCLVWGRDERVLAAMNAKEKDSDRELSLTEAEAALA